MDNCLFDQLSFLRHVTLHTVKDLSETEACIIPEGFNNNILWNLGHIYSAQEQFAFHFAEEPMELPEGFSDLFKMGSKPADWTVQPPTLPELLGLLKDQPSRIRERLINRLGEEVPHPFSIPGLSLKTIGQLLTFNLYHEGVHVQAIRMLQKINDRERIK